MSLSGTTGLQFYLIFFPKFSLAKALGKRFLRWPASLQKVQNSTSHRLAQSCKTANQKKWIITARCKPKWASWPKLTKQD